MSRRTLLIRRPGCVFHPRCPLAVDRCRTEIARLRAIGPGRTVACHRAEEVLGGAVPAGQVPEGKGLAGDVILGGEPASSAGGKPPVSTSEENR